MRIKTINMLSNYWWVALNGTDKEKFDYNKNHEHTFVKVGSSWWEAKYIGTDIESHHGVAYYRAVKKVSVKEVKAKAPVKNWCFTSGDIECMDYIIFE